VGEWLLVGYTVGMVLVTFVIRSARTAFRMHWTNPVVELFVG
jgi:hypothetical protein